MNISKLIKRSIAILLSMVLSVSFCVYLLAADENTVSLQLSQNSMYTSVSEQNVTLDIVTSEEVSITGLEYVIKLPDGWSAAEPTFSNSITGAVWNEELNKLTWISFASAVSGLTNLGSIVITIPENTPADEYEIQIIQFDANDDATGFWAEQASYSITLTIEEAPDSYAATLESANIDEITVGDTLYVNVGSNMAFNSTEMTITYEPSLVTFDQENSALGEATVTDDLSGTITLKDYGEEKTRDDKYRLAFTANSDGDAIFAITSAGFGTAVSAETGNVTPADTPDNVTITINPASVKVTLPNIYSGNTSVNENANYYFKPSTTDGAYYDYALPTATMGGNEVPVEVDNENGGWVIENVTGDLVITGNRTAKSYTVTWTGDGADDVENKPGTATYDVPFTITLPEDIEPGLNVGYTYGLIVTIGDQEYEFATADYTIPGASITGDITIEVTKTPVDPNKFTVTVKGGEGDVTANVTEVDVEEDDTVTLTLNAEAGYAYPTTYTIGNGAAQNITWVEGKATITDVTGNVVINVDKVVDKDAFTLTVGEYLTLNGKMMRLIKVEGVELAQNKVYTYKLDTGAVNMYYSTAYNAYVYLVIDDSNIANDQEYKAAALENISIAEATATTVSQSYDVNMSNTTDVNDAQLVWNMYQAKMYAGFTNDVTIEKFLRADVDTDGDVDMDDAAKIVSEGTQA